MAKNRRFEIVFNVINEEAKRANAEVMKGFRDAAKEADKQAKAAGATQAREAKRAADQMVREWNRANAEMLRDFRKVQADKAREDKKAADQSAREWNRANAEMLRDFRRVQAEQARESKKTSDGQAKDAKRAADQSARDWIRANAEMLRDFRRVQADRAREEKRAADQSARDWNRANAEMLRDFRKVQAERGREAKKRAKEDLDFAEAMRRSQNRVADSIDRSHGGMIGVGVAAGAASVGFQKILEAVSKIPDAIEAARLASQKLGADFGEKREELAELATTMGVEADNRFVIANAEFNRRTGFKFDEGLKFRGAFAGAGQQYQGTRIEATEFGELEEQAARLALAKKIDPKIAGDFAGGLLGVKDYTKFGKQGSEQALADFNASVGIMAMGQGEASVNLQQAKEVNAAFTNEDEFKGLINDPKVTAMLVSAAAERNPSESATVIKAAFRGMRGFNDKDAGPLLNRAGITPDVEPIEAFRKLAPIVQAEARQKGLKVDDVLKQYFPDRLTSEGIGVFLNRGVGEKGQGVFEQRERLLAGQVPGQPMVGGVGPALAAVEGFGKSDRGALRAAQAEAVAAEAARGAGVADIAILREQAIAELKKKGQFGDTATTGVKVENAIGKTFGWMFGIDPEEERVQAQMRQTLAARGRRAGLDMTSRSIPAPFSTEATNEAFNEAIAQIKAAGGDWKSDGEVKQLLKDLPAKIADAIRPGAPMVNPRPLPGRAP